MLRLLVFLTIFLTLYAAMHLVVYRGIRPLLPHGYNPKSFGKLWIGLMLTAPMLARILERGELEFAARSLAFAGYVWMGFLFLAFSGFTLLFALRLLFIPWRLLTRSPGISWRHGPRSALLVLIAAGLIGSYGFFEAQTLRIEAVRIETDKLPPHLERLRIAQISDLHLGLVLRSGTVNKVAAALASLEPDLIVATGDLVDARISHDLGLATPLADLKPRLGKFAVTGNHEYYSGLAQALDFLERCGFTVLRARALAVGDVLNLVGVDDPAGGGHPDETSLLKDRDPKRFTLLLKHRPWVKNGAEGQFDLQLSGHAHRGQIFPFNLITGLEYPLQNGLQRLTTSSWIYTSRGTGTWGPPMRVFSPPEVTCIDLVRTPSP